MTAPVSSGPVGLWGLARRTMGPGWARMEVWLFLACTVTSCFPRKSFPGPGPYHQGSAAHEQTEWEPLKLAR
jgi:hypothetical protein